MKKGLFIVIEGIDGSGKGTQSKLLNTWLKGKGHSAFLTMEPTEGDIGKLLREALKHGNVAPKPLALLFAADRIEHNVQIKKKLSEGKNVICDRYMYSSIAYQGAQGVDKEWIGEINKFALVPDVIIYLDVSPAVGLGRISSKGSFRSLQKEAEYLEKKEFLEKVRNNYLEQANENSLFFTINADLLLKDVQTAVRRVVGRFLKEEGEKNNVELTEFFKN